MGITITGDIALVLLGFGVLTGFMAGILFTIADYENEKRDNEKKNNNKGIDK